MINNVFRVNKQDEYRKAGTTDLIRLVPARDDHPLFVVKWVLEVLVYAIIHQEFISLSGPTGSGKTSLLEALAGVPENFKSVCAALRCSVKPIKLYNIEMATYETPGELYQRRSLKSGSTYDEKSRLVEALEDAARTNGKTYPLIWLREMGRVNSPAVQGGS
jgi:energy-coupling factor transporter ATP-binding protein EcfA2